ncbi:MAG: alkyl hydroperoxide reductase [Chitinophagaceae bacterium]
MKRHSQLLTGASVLLLLSACKNKQADGFEVTGHIKNATAKTVYLEETSLINFQPLIVDSAVLGKDGSFDVKVMPKEETVYSLRLNNRRIPLLSVINDSKKVTVEADETSTQPYAYSVSGSEASSQLKEYMTASNTKIQQFVQATNTEDSLSRFKAKDSLVNAAAANRKNTAADLKNYTIDFIYKSNHPALSLFVLGAYQSLSSQYGFATFSEGEVTTFINNASSKFPQHKSLADIKAMMKPKSAPDFTLPDTSGKPVALSSFKGKYVLVDFWASWCQPCRMENPNVVKAYNQYKDKNFTVLGVSLDKQKDAWVAAIKQDSLAWTHVSDLQFWNSAVVPLYSIESIPYNVLLDPNGMIIGRGLRGEELDNKLKEVLK